MELLNECLISKDSKGKIRVVKVIQEYVDDVYIIRRFTGQFKGVMTAQPEISISVGKAKRSVAEQAMLEYNSQIRKYLDKGYKKLSVVLPRKKLEDLTMEQLIAALPEDTTDSQGRKKPMLAKESSKCATSVYEKDWEASYKLDGVRTMFMLEDDHSITAASRGGKDYNFSTKHLRELPQIEQFFSKYPNLILDGELYIHGRPLQWLSGVARMEKEDERTGKLEFWIFDIAGMEGTTFKERKQFIEDEVAPLFVDCPEINVVEHISISGWVNIKKLHDAAVVKGFEGLVLRDPKKEYGFNKRDARMIKIKEFQEDEFEIVGHEAGLRDEDMVFKLKTKKGLIFEAKPVGTRELREMYLNDMKQLIGKMATVKFFYYSEGGKPTLPSLKCIRDYNG